MFDNHKSEDDELYLGSDIDDDLNLHDHCQDELNKVQIEYDRQASHINKTL